MKKIHLSLFLLLSFFTVELNAQDIKGEWMISTLITDDITQEYSLKPHSDEPFSNYGNLLSILDNNRFNSHYTAFCGLDCFTTSTGKYVLTDKDHIQFTIETVEFYGTCHGKTSLYTFPLDIGLYYIRRKNDAIDLIKSNGDIAEDELNISYIDSIDLMLEEKKKFENIFEWIAPDFNLNQNPDSVAAFYMSKKNIENYSVLCSRTVYRQRKIILIEVDNKYHYLFYDTKHVDSLENDVVSSLALYDKSLVNRIDVSVNELNKNKRKFKIETLNEKEGSLEIVTNIYKKKDELKIITYEQITSSGKILTDYYFENDSLIYIEISNDVISDGKHFISRKAFYTTGEYTFITKELAREWYKIDSTEYHVVAKKLKLIREKIKS